MNNVSSLSTLCLNTLAYWILQNQAKEKHVPFFSRIRNLVTFKTVPKSKDGVIQRLARIHNCLPSSLRQDLGIQVLNMFWNIIKSKPDSNYNGELHIGPIMKRDVLRFLKLCVKITKVFGVGEGIWLWDELPTGFKPMLSITRLLEDELRSEFLKILSEDEEIQLSALTIMTPRSFLPQTLDQLLHRECRNLNSLHLWCSLRMPPLPVNNLRELYLRDVEFYHEPLELTQIPLLSVLVIQNVRRIPDRIYKQLTCKLTFPCLEKIYIGVTSCVDEDLLFVYRNYSCNCISTCFLGFF